MKHGNFAYMFKHTISIKNPEMIKSGNEHHKIKDIKMNMWKK
jgi:hypothetical protein